MTRGLIVALLLAHLGVAYWIVSGSADQPWPIPDQSPRDPERVALQVRPESIRLVTPVVPAAPAPSASASVSPAAAPAPGASVPLSPVPVAPASAPVQSPQGDGAQNQPQQPAKP